MPRTITPELANKLYDALNALVDECNTNDDFATVHQSEMDALERAEHMLRSVNTLPA